MQGHRDGYGFAIQFAEGGDIYLSARQMQFVFDGDEVLVAITGLGRREVGPVVCRFHGSGDVGSFLQTEDGPPI